MQTRTIVTPKSLYVQERDQFYSEWRSAFFRELFQNEVDAGAKTINIDLRMAPAKSSFGRATPEGEVIRIIFAGDGCGMDQRIIDEVYFKPGESTKRDSAESVGGYGRARLMTCFSQMRYGIVTNDRIVEGDGPDYVHYSLPEMVEQLNQLARRQRAEADLATGQEERSRLMDRVWATEDEVKRVSALAAQGGIKGCVVEVDINPNEYGAGRYHNPTLEKMKTALDEYLSQSQLPCRVIVNGEERKDKLVRGPARRAISVEMHGEKVEFATVHLRNCEKGTREGQVIVRVDGATMFTDRAQSKQVVIVELDKARAREVMTSNRDGMREPFSSAYETFKAELASDVRSAIDRPKDETVRVEGQLGAKKAVRPAVAITSKGDDASLELAREIEHSDETYEKVEVSPSELQRNGVDGIPFNLIAKVLEGSRYDYQSFISDYKHGALRRKLDAAAADLHGVEMVKAVIDAMEPDEYAFVIGVIRRRMDEQRERERQEFESRLKDMNDVLIHVDGDVSSEVKSAIRRNDPRKWDPATGRGQRARLLLSQWTVLCEIAVETLMRHNPNQMPETVEWTTGFVYSAPRSFYYGNERHEKWIMEAEHIAKDGAHALLVNPVDSRGRMKYNPANPADRQRLAVLAMHEACHICSSYHNEDFAALLTDVMSNFDFRDAAKRTAMAAKSVRDLYAAGKIRAQAMDEDEGPRPYERLMAQAHPESTAMAGLMAAPENAEVPSAIREGYRSSFARDADGAVEIDCGELTRLDQRVSAGWQQGRDLASERELEDEEAYAAPGM